MSFVRSLWSDLLEKRLWPVAVALLLALVAIPVVLGGSSDAVVTPVGATGATGAAASTAQVALGPAVAQRRDRTGKLRDPFKQDAAPADQGPTGPTGASGGATGTTGPASGGGGDGRPAVSTPGGAPKDAPGDGASSTAPASDSRDGYVVVVRLGTKGSKRPARRVKRLSPLPSAENPAFVYLGVTKADDTAVFLLSDDVGASGDGACRPSKASCESVLLQPGDTELLEVTDAEGVVTTHQLDLIRIDKG